MIAIRTHFDGNQIILPDALRGLPPGAVIVVYENGKGSPQEPVAWMKAQEQAFADTWNNDEDAVYDNL